jgi:hypothetical protein
LCAAIEARDPGQVSALLEAGAPVDAQVLELAVDPEVLASRLRGSDPEDRDYAIAMLLLEHADPNVRWRKFAQGRGASTPGGSTQGFGSTNPDYQYLAASITTLWDDPAPLALLTERGLDIEGVPGGEALYRAVAAQHMSSVKTLLAAGAPVNHRYVNHPRNTPLSEAIQTRNVELIALLEEAGAVEW